MEKNQKESRVNPGNTNNCINSPDKKGQFGRFFQLTLNNEKNGDIEACNSILMQKYIKIVKYLKNRKQLKYFISCKETNKKGFNHIHIYCQFEKYTKLSIKKLEGAHIEICRGSVQDNIDYIKKDGFIIEEYGDKLLNYNKLTIKEVLECKNNEELLNSDIRFIKCINEVKNNSITWIQPPLNTTKEIYFVNSYDKNLMKNAKFIVYDTNTRQFSGLSNQIIINLSSYINPDTLNQDDDEFDEFDFINFNIPSLLYEFNIPLNCKYQIFYPADIKKIYFIYPEKYKSKILIWFNSLKFYFKNHNVHFSL